MSEYRFWVFYLLSPFAACVDLNLQANVPVVVPLPLEGADSTHLLTISLPVSLSLSSCVFSRSPSLMFTSSTPSSLLLTTERLMEIAKKSQCAEESSSSLFATLVSPVGGNVTIDLSPLAVTTTDNLGLGHLAVPGATLFSVKDNQYKTYKVQLGSISQGVQLDVVAERGVVEVFVSFCNDFEGLLLGKAVYPSALSIAYNASEIVNLLENVSCPDSGALYHDLDNSPPELLVRIRSIDASGAVVVSRPDSEIESATRSLDVKYHDSSSIDVTITKDQPFNFKLPIENDNTTFEIVNGSVSISVKECDESSMLELGQFLAGKHFINALDIFENMTTCDNSTLSMLDVVMRSKQAVVHFSSFEPAPSNASFSWAWWEYVLLFILTTVIVMTVGYLIYCFSTIKRRSVDIDHEVPTNNIPMATSWM